MKTPTNLGELRKEWFTEGLFEAGVLESASVTDFSVEPIGADFGFLSTVGRVSLSYDRTEPEAPRTLVVKLEPDTGTLRQIGDELHAFEREIRFYREVGPFAPIRLARLYFATTEAPDYAMVMEDLSFAEPGDQVQGLHAEQVRKIAADIGRLQGHYWGKEALSGLAWMPETNGTGEDFRALWPSFVEHFGYALTPEGRALGDRVVDQMTWVDAEIAQRPKTIVHADLRADNLMLGPVGTPEEVLILDWQLAIRSMGAFDVARMMGGSELPDERHGHQLDVLQSWYGALRETGVRDYDWEEALRDLRLGALSAMSYPVHFHLGLLDATGRAKTVIELMCQRLFDSAAEMDAGSVLPR